MLVDIGASVPDNARPKAFEFLRILDEENPRHRPR